MTKPYYQMTAAEKLAAPKQTAWWERAANAYGLDATAAGSLSMRQFSVLPVLKALQTRIV